MIKAEYAEWLRQRQLWWAFHHQDKINLPFVKFAELVNGLSDDDIIDSYRMCKCGKEFLTKKEQDGLIEKYDDPIRIFNETPLGHE
jgi:hypothetical protein